MTDYSPIIGLEIHAELTTDSKLFCRCPNVSADLNTAPNTAVCPVCLGLPGALPVANKTAVGATIQLGESLGCTIPDKTKWDRKNYFYPDLPKGYQISQYDQPLCQAGELSWHDPTTGERRSVALTRIHLEEDTGKLTHPEGRPYSLIDYNRSSIPLLELVTEPVITSAQEAKLFSQEYQHHLRELGIAEASMEKGQMRCEANISLVTKEAAADSKRRLSGTKVEIKNLNSFRSLERAISYEIERQSKMLATGQRVRQETRGWNETEGETYTMRAKETADDYRYFPEPDLGELETAIIERATINQKLTRSTLYELLASTNLESSAIRLSLDDPKRRAFWEKLIESALPKELYKVALQWINQEPTIGRFNPDELRHALTKLANQEITPAVFKEAILTGEPGELANTIETVKQEQQVDNLDTIIDEVIANHQKEVAEYRLGKTQLFGFFVGQVRKALGGKGDAVTIAEVLKRRLE